MKNGSLELVAGILSSIVLVAYPLAYVFLRYIDILNSTRDFYLALLFSAFPYLVIATLTAVILQASGIEAYLKSKAIDNLDN